MVVYFNIADWIRVNHDLEDSWSDVVGLVSYETHYKSTDLQSAMYDMWNE